MYAKRTVPSSTDAYARVAFKVNAQTSSRVTLLRLRDTATDTLNGGYVYVSPSGALGFHNDATNTFTASSAQAAAGWHVLELHLNLTGSGLVQVWLDGAAVPDLTATAVVSANPITSFQVGETAGVVADVEFDDAAFSTSRIGVGGDVAAPTAPGSFTATASGPFSVDLSWTASTDDTGVVAYDILRNNAMLVAGLPPGVLGWTDSTAVASTSYTYTIRARDAAGNVSPLVTAVATTPAATPPSFADGFESGTLAAWSTSGGLTLESSDVRSGAFAAEGSAPTTAAPMFAKRSVTAATDAYARVAFKVLRQTSSRVTLLRLRDTATGTGNGGYVYIAPSGALGFHADAANTFTASSVAAGPGWHVVELHLTMSATAGVVQVWLDGNPVADLGSAAANLGANPVANLQVGETASVLADVEFDDAAFSTSRIGLG
jgi:hypothetical protein